MPRFHPLSLIEPPIGVFGVALFNLGRKEPILPSALGEIFHAVAAGELKTVVDRVFSLDREGAVEAHAYLHARSNLGKVVLATE
jgi:NADPH:quinone reductase-like Zn-dependent oxidoreductase